MRNFTLDVAPCRKQLLGVVPIRDGIRSVGNGGGGPEKLSIS